ncbi:MAG: nicotinate (nicotinamide) nucleotide adenylyltransferase [Nostocaceae cyanobacterium]|nr:nicotinate (nicotinamide) nucleotide adenylyltransferase [Nostocaceae cyanobacterium]
MEQVAIFGGTFDPVHWGHLLIAEAALNQLGLDQVLWVPSPNPPHKLAAGFQHRCSMVELAICDNPAFAIAPTQINHSGTSFAIDTLTELSTYYQDIHWYWIVGLDTFQTLPRWYRAKELVSLCDWLVAPRNGSYLTIEQSESICQEVEQQIKAESANIRWQLLNTPLVAVSSSLIRHLWQEKKSIRYLVPEVVRRYIASHQLYKGNSE